MNKVKLFGKVQYVSDLKIDISKKLKVYMEIEIITVSGDIFKCIFYEKICEELCGINVGDYVYGTVFCCYDNYCNIVIEEIYTL